MVQMIEQSDGEMVVDGLAGNFFGTVTKIHWYCKDVANQRDWSR